jgi:hypothetical protein
MIGKEYSDALDTLGLTIASAARFLRISAQLSGRIAAGRDTLGWPRSALLRLMVRHRVTPQQVDEIMSDFDKEDDTCDDNEAD